MSEPWSREEVEAIVADYLAMFLEHLRGGRLNKKEHNRLLRERITRRSARAVEDKHMNISAALNTLGFPHLPGYIPLRNYQRLLLEVVAERLDGAEELRELVSQQVDEPARPRRVGNILAARVAPPRLKRSERGVTAEDVGRFMLSSQIPRVDYLAREASNRALGLEGEKFVIEYERERLSRARRDRFAKHVEQVSETCGDRMGFDILSYEVNGAQRLIEVKTTQFAKETPFYVTRHELAVSRQRAEHYYLYRVFRIRHASPRFFDVRGQLDETCTLLPIHYRGTIP